MNFMAWFGIGFGVAFLVAAYIILGKMRRLLDGAAERPEPTPTLWIEESMWERTVREIGIDPAAMEWPELQIALPVGDSYTRDARGRFTRREAADG